MRAVQLAICMDASLMRVYGPSWAGVIYLPDGERGEDIMARAKQTEAERLECVRRGADER